MYVIGLLVLAAVLEVGGDALIRSGLGSGRVQNAIIFMIAGVLVLGVYGFMVNLTKLDFSRLMGIYIVLFFVVAQIIAILIFKERLHQSVIVGGLLIAAGGVVMTLWHA